MRSKLFLFAFLGLGAVAASFLSEGQTPSSTAMTGQQHECLVAARRALGPKATVLKCHEVNQAGVLELVATIPVAPKSRSAHEIFSKDLVILRRIGGEWKTVLRASRLIQNDAGYIGSDYIDDCSPFWADAIEFRNERPDGRKGLVVSIQWRAFENDTDPWPTDVAWDSSTGRYREITGDGFRAEKKNLPHECPGGVAKGSP